MPRGGPTELYEAIRKTGACRYFKPGPVPDDVLARLWGPISEMVFADRYGEPLFP
jgi:hypothetical protein